MNAYVFPAPDGVPCSRVLASVISTSKISATATTMALNVGFTSPIVMHVGGWKTQKMMRR